MATNAQLREAQVAIPSELPTAIQQVRDDDLPADWCLCGHEADGVGLRMVGSGEGGAAAHESSTSAVFTCGPSASSHTITPASSHRSRKRWSCG